MIVKDEYGNINVVLQDPSPMRRALQLGVLCIFTSNFTIQRMGKDNIVWRFSLNSRHALQFPKAPSGLDLYEQAFHKMSE